MKLQYEGYQEITIFAESNKIDIGNSSSITSDNRDYFYVIDRCLRQWHEAAFNTYDFRMVAYCINKQVESYNGLKFYKRSSESTYRSKIVTEAQQLLKKLGYNTGKDDGILGKKTETAIRTFQKDHNIEINGKVDKYTLMTLRNACVGLD